MSSSCPRPWAEGWGLIPAPHRSPGARLTVPGTHRGRGASRKAPGCCECPSARAPVYAGPCCRRRFLFRPWREPCRRKPSRRGAGVWMGGSRTGPQSAALSRQPWVTAVSRNGSQVMLAGESFPGETGGQRHCAALEKVHRPQGWSSPPRTQPQPHGRAETGGSRQLLLPETGTRGDRAASLPRFQVSITNPTMRRTSGSSRRPWRPSQCPSAARKGLLASDPPEKVP